MMRIVAIVALLSGVSALKKPSNADIMRMTLKSRSFNDVSLDMEAGWEKEGEETKGAWIKDTEAGSGTGSTEADSEQDLEGPGRTTYDELVGARGAFAGYVIVIVAMAVGTCMYIKRQASIEADESSESSEVRPDIYNKVVPAAFIFMATFMFFSVVGSIVAINKKVYDVPPKTNMPGYEGRKVGFERIGNPGERAFFAAFALVAQATIGFLICVYLRKLQQVQITTAIILKMAARGAAVGTLATLSVEFIRLPFHDYMMNEDAFNGRVLVVLGWVGFVALLEEALKIAAVALGLKRSETDTESALGSAAQFIAESPQALAICGLAAGIGFAFVENIPRMYALACQKPLAEIVSGGYWSEPSQEMVIDEGSLRAQRIWTFVFWGIFNLQPWLTGLAAIQLAKVTGKEGSVSPGGWISVLWFVVMVHFFFDLLDRSHHPLVEFIGCCAIPYAMYTFKKSWEALSTSGSDDGLLDERE